MGLFTSVKLLYPRRLKLPINLKTVYDQTVFRMLLMGSKRNVSLVKQKKQIHKAIK
jgi:hypothetical protein